jgi:hypothetical protein
MKNSTDTRQAEQGAESVYIGQYHTIYDAIERLQAVLDNMLAPGDDEITWADVAHHAHIVEALQRAELA